MTKPPSPAVPLIGMLPILLIVAAGCWVYGPALHGAWVWDDDLYITHNPLLHDPARLWKAWFVPGSFVEYYPIEQTVQWLQWQFWGSDTFGYHVTNVALHLVSALLVWRLLARFGLRLAWVGGLIFAIHPVQVESVAWISELKNTLSLPFFLLAMIAWIDFDRRGKATDYLLALGLFLTAMLCKITMAPFPVVLLLYAWWQRGRIGWRDLKISLPFFIVSLALVEVTHSAASTWGQSQMATGEFLPLGGSLACFALAGLAFSAYFVNCLAPVDLLPLYPVWPVHPPSPLDFLPWPILAGVIWFLWRRRDSWGRHALLGLGFFLLILAPFLTFGLAFFPRDTWIMNHYLYIPIIGLIGLAVAAMEDLHRKLPPRVRPGAIFVVALLVALLTWESHAYAGIFASPRALWSYTAAHNPGATPAHNNLGVSLLETNQLPEAMLQFREAIQLQPDYPEAHNGLGNALMLSGHPAEATTEYQKAIKLLPHYPEAHNGLANVLLQAGKYPEAMAEIQEALKYSPRYAEAHCNLGLVYAQTGRLPEAIEQFQIALTYQPHNPKIRQVLDLLLNAQNGPPPAR